VAKFRYDNAFVEIDGIDVSDHIRSAGVNQTKPELDTTAMGDGGHTRIQGLSDDSFDLECYQDFAVSELHSILTALYASGAEFTMVVKPDKTAAAAATNPRFTATAILTAYAPLGGEVGSLAMVSLNIPVNGTISEVTTGT
jgi:hypothetical protein